MRPHRHVWSDKLPGPIKVLGPHFCLIECWRYCCRPAPPFPFSFLLSCPNFYFHLFAQTQTHSKGRMKVSQPQRFPHQEWMEIPVALLAACLLSALVNRAGPWEADSQAWGLQLVIELLCTPAALREQTQPGKFLTWGCNHIITDPGYTTSSLHGW